MDDRSVIAVDLAGNPIGPDTMNPLYSAVNGLLIGPPEAQDFHDNAADQIIGPVGELVLRIDESLADEPGATPDLESFEAFAEITEKMAEGDMDDPDAEPELSAGAQRIFNQMKNELDTELRSEREREAQEAAMDFESEEPPEPTPGGEP